MWDHLEELAQRLRRILFVLAITTMALFSLPSDLRIITTFQFSNYRPMISSILEFIQSSLLPEGVDLIAFNWMDTFYIYLMVALTLGFILTLPLTAYEIYMFINPALYANEKRYLYTFVASFAILFFIGIIYAYFILLPTTFHILYRLVYQSNIIPFFSVKDFFNMVAVGMLGSGLFYTFPLIIYLLVKADLIEVKTLKKNRKELLVGLLIVTAILTPDPTPFSMLLMSVPFYLLFELTIQILSKGSTKSTEEVFQRGIMASKKILSRDAVNKE